MFIDEENKEINCKIVYWGHQHAGKSTSISYVYSNTEIAYKGKLQRVTNDNEVMILANMLVKDFVNIKDYKIRFHLYAVPGEVVSDNFLKKMLMQVSGIIFVSYSSIEICPSCKENHNTRSLDLLKELLLQQNKSLNDIPLVLQINRRDWPNPAPVDLIRIKLGLWGNPFFESIACKGIGVWESFYKMTELIAAKLREIDLSTLRKI